MNEPHCDSHGPYTAEEAAAYLTGAWKPKPTGFICAPCRATIREMAHALADSIDEAAYRHACAAIDAVRRVV